MKTERRHELQHNELADWIQGHYQRIKPYATSIVAVFVAALVLYWAYTTLADRSARKTQQEWALLVPKKDAAETIKAWTELAASHSASTPLGMATRMKLGNYCLQMGGGTQIFNRERTTEVKDFLNRAITAYSELQKDARDVDVRTIAALKLAQAQECVGNLEAAKKDYALVAEAGKKSPFAEFAKARAADVGQQSTKDFYQSLLTMMKAGVGSTVRPSDILGETPGLPGSVTDDKFKGFDIGPGPSTPPTTPPNPTDKKPEPTPEKTPEKTTEPAKTEPAKTEPGTIEPDKKGDDKAPSTEPGDPAKKAAPAEPQPEDKKSDEK